MITVAASFRPRTLATGLNESGASFNFKGQLIKLDRPSAPSVRLFPYQVTLLHVHISRVAPGRRDIAANVLVRVILIPKKCFIGAFLFVCGRFLFLVFLG